MSSAMSFVAFLSRAAAPCWPLGAHRADVKHAPDARQQALMLPLMLGVQPAQHFGNDALGVKVRRQPDA